jgi:thiosulfate dehydrogenase
MNRTCAIVTGLLMLAAQPGLISAGTATSTSKTSAKSPGAADATVCAACHGANGEGSPAAHVPRIAGQSAEYLQKQLDDYASGARDSAIMANFAKALSFEQRGQLAARYAAMSAPLLSEPVANPKQLARGHRLAYQGDEDIRVQACNSCHGPDGSGVLHAAPYLAGQSSEYISSALHAFHAGSRKNDAGELMRSVAGHLADADIAAASAYFANEGSATRP